MNAGKQPLHLSEMAPTLIILLRDYPQPLACEQALCLGKGSPFPQTESPFTGYQTTGSCRQPMVQIRAKTSLPAYPLLFAMTPPSEHLEQANLGTKIPRIVSPVAMVTGVHFILLMIFVVSHFLSAKVSPERRLNPGFRDLEKVRVPFP